MADGEEQTGVAGSGPLFEHGEAGQKAAEEPVKIPGSDDKRHFRSERRERSKRRATAK